MNRSVRRDREKILTTYSPDPGRVSACQEIELKRGGGIASSGLDRELKEEVRMAVGSKVSSGRLKKEGEGEDRVVVRTVTWRWVYLVRLKVSGRMRWQEVNSRERTVEGSLQAGHTVITRASIPWRSVEDLVKDAVIGAIVGLDLELRSICASEWHNVRDLLWSDERSNKSVIAHSPLCRDAWLVELRLA